jgi:membrane protease YdiL (CAAX protease family)
MKNNIKRDLYLMLFAMELALVLIAFIITLFTKKPILSLFTSTAAPLAFLIVSAAAAGIAGFFTFLTLKFTVFNEVRKISDGMISDYKLSYVDAFIISITAGICEEILFRAVLQPMWGIWLSSFVFVFIHGYLNPSSWKKSLAGVSAYAISLALGYIFINYGLIPAMVFHAVYDFAALSFMKRFSVPVESAAN